MKCPLAVFLAGAALAACNGWPHAPKLEEARDKPEKYATYAQAQAEPQLLTVSGRRWMVTPARVTLTGAKLKPIGSMGETTIYAEASAQEPYAVLYAASGGVWQRVVPIE